MAEHPPEVQALLDERQIRDVLLRYCRGADRCDLELLRSAYHADAIHEYGPYRMNAHGFAEIIVESLGAQFCVTSHLLSNERIEIDGDSARCESYVQAVHRMNRDGQDLELVLALRYLDRLERRQRVWGIVERRTVHDWNRISKVEETYAEAAEVLPGRSDRDDPSYS